MGRSFDIDVAEDDRIGHQRIFLRNWELLDMRVSRTYAVAPSSRTEVATPNGYESFVHWQTIHTLLPLQSKWTYRFQEIVYDQPMDEDGTTPGTRFIRVTAVASIDGYPWVDLFEKSYTPVRSNWSAVWNAENKRLVELNLFVWPDCPANITAPKFTLEHARELVGREYVVAFSRPMPLSVKMKTGWMLYLEPARRRLVHQFRYNDEHGNACWVRYVDAETGELIRHPYWNPVEGA